MTRILIVEDDAQIRAMLEETLQQEGYQTDIAHNGADAMERYRRAPADLVVTDILMPEKEGLGLITELRGINPNVKIIAISGGAPQLSSGCNLELARMFGAQRSFQKPLDIDALLQAINTLLS
jgi:DNA-binding response OmpR family regulator